LYINWTPVKMPVVILSYCCNTFTYEHPKMGFSCTCLMYAVISFNTEEVKTYFRTDLQDRIYICSLFHNSISNWDYIDSKYTLTQNLYYVHI
jgi:hypothetical protein